MVYRGSKKKPLTYEIIYIVNEADNGVTSTKFLGVIIDVTMKRAEHVQLIKSKIYKGIGIISKARKLPKKVNTCHYVLLFYLPLSHMLYIVMANNCVMSSPYKL